MALPLASQAVPDSAPSEAFVLRGGAWVAEPYELGLVQPPTRSVVAERGRLGYLVQSADARPLTAELCQNVVDALVQTYYAEAGSIPRALREALLAANEALFEHNVRADTAARLLAGVGCVVVRGEELYLARLGPACVWLFSEGTLEQFPLQSLWYKPGSRAAADVDRDPPAGMRLDVEPEQGHIELPPHALAVLLSQELQRVVQPTQAFAGFGRRRSRADAFAPAGSLAGPGPGSPGGGAVWRARAGGACRGHAPLDSIEGPAALTLTPAASVAVPMPETATIIVTQPAASSAATPMPGEPAEEWSVQPRCDAVFRRVGGRR